MNCYIVSVIYVYYLHTRLGKIAKLSTGKELRTGAEWGSGGEELRSSNHMETSFLF